MKFFLLIYFCLAQAAFCQSFQSGKTNKNETFSGGNVFFGYREIDRMFATYSGDQKLVGGLDGPESYLSLRSGPSSEYPEKLKLNAFNIVVMTGDISQDNKWAKVECVIVSTDSHGDIFKSAMDAFEIKVTGWISVDYLFNYLSEEPMFEGWNYSELQDSVCDVTP